MFESEEVLEIYNRINGDKSRFLSICTGLENAIEVLIAHYYALGDEDYKNFLGVIFANDVELTFSKKINMLERFLKKYLPEYLKDKPDFIQKLNRVRKLRNKYAHSINLTPEELTAFIGKKYYKLGFIEEGVPKEETVSSEDILARNTEAGELLQEISNLDEIFMNLAIERFNKHLELIESIKQTNLKNKD